MSETFFTYQPQRLTIQALWRQLGSPDLFGRPVLWLSLLLYFPTTMWVDPLKLGGTALEWTLFFFLGHTVFWFTLKGLSSFLRSKLDWSRPRPLINFAVMAVSVVCRFIVVLGVILLSIPEIDTDWVLTRMATVIAMIFILFFGGGLLTVSRSQHTATVNNLNLAAEQLEQQRIDTVKILAETELQLTETVRRTLLPHLENIRNLIKNIKSRDQLIDDIRTTIRNKVRPLSLELHNFAVNIEPISERRELVKAKLAVIPRRINLHDAMWPVFVFIVINTWILFAMKSIGAESLIPQAILSWCTYPIIINVTKIFIPRDLSVGAVRGITILLITHYLGSVPLFLTVIKHVTVPLSYQFVVITYFVSGAIYLTLANISVIAAEQRRLELELVSVNTQLHHELRILDQKLWVARRNWSSLIHGPVQSSLTVALFKLQNSPHKVHDQVLDTLNELNEMLEQGPTLSTPLDEGLEAIRNTWEGVCRFQFYIPAEVHVLLSHDQIASDCLLEIATEIVGNAYRHGGARWVTLNVYLNNHGDLNIFSQNDGALNIENHGSGLGSKMLDEVTLHWNLERKATSAVTEFRAILPIQK
ncbi:MAG: hypothetical protein RIS75_1336 [Actinomycetota bacterium]|jgi:hypothetical protein